MITKEKNWRERERERFRRDDGIKIKGVGKRDWRAVVAGEMRETNSNVDRVELSGLWARRISRCVSPTWPTSYAHPRCLSFPSRPPFLSRSFAASNYTRSVPVIFDPPNRAQQTYPRTTIRQTVLKFTRLPITDHHQRLMILLFFIANRFDSSLSNFYEIIHRVHMINTRYIYIYILLSRKCDRYAKSWINVTVCRNTNNVSKYFFLIYPLER